MLAWLGAAAVQLLCERRIHNVVGEGRLPRTRHACHAHKPTQWKLHVHIAQVILAGTFDFNRIVANIATLAWHRNRLIAAQVGGGQRFWMLKHRRHGTRTNHFPAMHASARADLHHKVTRANRILIVLHNNHGVTEIA